MQTTDITALKEAIECLLDIAAGPLSEYQLIQLLNDQGWSLPTSGADTLALFTSHFLVYNALYQLQDDYRTCGKYLRVSALAIQVLEGDGQAAGQAVLDMAADAKLRDYYLNMDNLHEANEESVNRLLKQFWERYVAADDMASALAVLSLQTPVTLAQVKSRYRTLAMTHHPDRGGDSEVFQRINWAFGVLQRRLR